MKIHPTAILDPRAEIDPEVEIGPYVVIEGPVRIGPRTRLLPHVTILGWTELGSDNVVHSGAVLGDAPQDRAYRGTESYVRIGNGNVFREGVQVHRGTAEGSATVIGDGNFFMANSHVAHNCRVGHQVTMANGAVLGGHVEVGDGAFLSAHVAVHQFVRVGRLTMLRGLSATSRDVPPFCIMDGQHTVRGINRVGLRRAGLTPERIRALQSAFTVLFRTAGNLSLRLERLAAAEATPEVEELTAFIRASRRGVCRGVRRGQAPGSDGGEG